MFCIVLAFSCIKLLLLNAYRSTDFEVHRNWLAITHSLPIKNWYEDKTSEWTLDYPPLFAYFEYVMSQVAYLFDKQMLDVKNLSYASDMTVLFQKLSVIVCDLVLAYGVKQCISELNKRSGRKTSEDLCFAYIFTNAALFIVDHIHFQYNGFLFGILFISFARVIQNNELSAAFWFCVLLNLKHIYLYLAPAYFVYLLRSYCFSDAKKLTWQSFNPRRLVQLAAIVVTVFAISFGPFIAMGQLQQVISRLFPFKRGLSHAYWAPNFWAAYNFADKVMAFAGKQTGLIQNATLASMTGGLVQEFEHTVLPSISPLVTFVLTACSMIPCLTTLWRRPASPLEFIRCVAMCGFCSYLFGWHVHEKAILLVTLPMSLISLTSRRDAYPSFLLNIVGNYSIFPLIFSPAETIIKLTALLIHAAISLRTLTDIWKWNTKKTYHYFEAFNITNIYLLFLAVVFLYAEYLHSYVPFLEHLSFLPLLVTSVYCCVGIIYLWMYMYYNVVNFKIDFKLKTK